MGRRISLVVGLLLGLAACKGVSPGAAGEGTVVLAEGAAGVHVGGRTFHLGLADGKALGELAILAGGQVFHVGGDGTVALPDALLKAAKANGGFTVLAPGYAPRRVALDQAEGAIALAPVSPLASATGSGTLKGPGITVEIPPGLVGSATGVALGGYLPQPTTSTVDRAAFLAKVDHAASACDAPIPCPPAKEAIGLVLSVNGPLQAGKLKLSYDLDALGQAPATAAAAKALLAAFAAIDASGNPAYRAVLARDYGIQLVGHQLAFDVNLGADAVTEGSVRVEVQGFALLGVQLELSVVSTVSGTLPLPALPAVLANRGLPSPPALAGGATAISNNGGTAIGNNGATVLGNNGGAFAGKVKIPFIEEAPKFRLTDYADFDWDSGTVTILDLARQPVVGAAVGMLDDHSRYRIDGLKELPAVVVLEAQVGLYRAYTVCRPPQPGALVTVDVGAATSGVADYVTDTVRSGGATAADVDFDGFADDVQRLDGWLDQPDACALVTRHDHGGVLDVNPDAADTMRGIFGLHRHVPRSLGGRGFTLPPIP